jgi:hypothetical protein
MKPIQKEILAAGEAGNIILSLSVILNCLICKDKKNSKSDVGIRRTETDSHHDAR